MHIGLLVSILFPRPGRLCTSITATADRPMFVPSATLSFACACPRGQARARNLVASTPRRPRPQSLVGFSSTGAPQAGPSRTRSYRLPTRPPSTTYRRHTPVSVSPSPAELSRRADEQRAAEARGVSRVLIQPLLTMPARAHQTVVSTFSLAPTESARAASSATTTATTGT